MTGIWNTPERESLRKTVRSFAEREVLPHASEWERTGELPRELHRKAGDAGLLGANFPESVGGGGGDGADAVIIGEEMHYAGAPGGVFASLFTCGIAVPHMIASGDERLIETYVKPTLRGDLIGSLAITEPGGGFLRSNDPAADRWHSRDVAAIATSRHLDHVIASYFIDAEADANANALPVGGLTVVHFPNNHLGYAITWFVLAAMVAGAYIMVMRQRGPDDRA